MYKYDSATTKLTLQSRLSVGYQGSVGIYHPQKNALRFFGGQAVFDKLYTTYSKYFTYEYMLNSSSWSASSPRDNNQLLYYMAATYNNSNYAVIHGGMYPESERICVNGDVRILDLACNTWKTISTKLVPRIGHSIIQRDTTLYIFGGNDGVLKNKVEEIGLQPFMTARTENECIG